MICPVCNKQLKDGRERCPNCGTTFYQPYGSPSQRSGRGMRKAVAVIAIVLAVAISVTAAIVVLNRKSDNSPELSSAASVRKSVVRAKVNTEAIGVKFAQGMVVAAYYVEIDSATGRETVRSAPAATSTLDSDGIYELSLEPGDYVVRVYDKDTEESELTLPEDNTADSGVASASAVKCEQKLRVNPDVDVSDAKDESSNSNNTINGREKFSTASLMTNYRFGEFVDFNGVAYFTDSVGLHRCNERYNTVLDKRECFRLATDGETVYYSVVIGKAKPVKDDDPPEDDLDNLETDEVEETETEEDFPGYEQLDGDEKPESYAKCVIYTMNTDGSHKKELFECRSQGEPVFVYNDKLYYIDRDLSDGSRSLYAYDLTEESDELLFENIESVNLSSNKLFVKTAADSKSRSYLKSYNYVTEKILKTNVRISDFWIDRDYLFYTKPRGEVTELYRRDTLDFKSSEPELIREFDSKMKIDFVNVNHAFIHTSVVGLDSGEWEYAYYRYSISDDEMKYISLDDFSDEYFIHPYSGGVIYYTADISEMSYLDNFSDVPVPCFAEYVEGYFLGTAGDNVYTCASDKDGTRIIRCRFDPPDYNAIEWNYAETVSETVSETEETTAEDKTVTDVRYNLNEFWEEAFDDKNLSSLRIEKNDEIIYEGESYLLCFLSGIPKGEEKPVLLDWAFVNPENGECFDSL